MDIDKSFTESLKKSTLAAVPIDIAESTIDSLMSNSLIKEIPVVKLFVGLAQVGVNIHDKLFLKKILTFLQNIDVISIEDRNTMIDEIDSSKKYRLKVGEKLLYVIDSCEDYEASERVAKLFSAFLSKKINYDEYLEASSIVTRISNLELKLFIDSYDTWSMTRTAKGLTHTGLVYSETEEVSVDLIKVEQADWKDPEEHYEADVSGGDISIMPTSAGDIIYEVFGMGHKERLRRMAETREKAKAQRKRDVETTITNSELNF